MFTFFFSVGVVCLFIHLELHRNNFIFENEFFPAFEYTSHPIPTYCVIESSKILRMIIL